MLVVTDVSKRSGVLPERSPSRANLDGKAHVCPTKAPKVSEKNVQLFAAAQTNKGTSNQGTAKEQTGLSQRPFLTKACTGSQVAVTSNCTDLKLSSAAKNATKTKENTNLKEDNRIQTPKKPHPEIPQEQSQKPTLIRLFYSRWAHDLGRPFWV
ncbi:hypothetical protein DSO57_1024231 [Entomophthora muscae]|uniref:Uncharacterized protein n=1 Tax=Entomophthora muscae TaxID=34485 RepID=A0ACC2TDX6_9FUNG|nr:hypothetical protein DSO57_1024231 [Entomophthora muscae]